MIRRDLSFHERQFAIAICCGMPNKVTAKALKIDPKIVQQARQELMASHGFDTPLEFALNVNAAVRERFKGN